MVSSIAAKQFVGEGLTIGAQTDLCSSLQRPLEIPFQLFPSHKGAYVRMWRGKKYRKILTYQNYDERNIARFLHIGMTMCLQMYMYAVSLYTEICTGSRELN